MVLFLVKLHGRSGDQEQESRNILKFLNSFMGGEDGSVRYFYCASLALN